MNDRIKIVIADDHKLLTVGLRMTVEDWEEFEVVGVASNGQETVDLCDEKRPDIVLLDMQMPVMSGIEAVGIIKEKYPDMKVVALTTFDDHATVTKAMAKGCDGFLLKVIDPVQLREALHSIVNGISIVDAQAMKMLIPQEKEEIKCVFTERELLVMQYICNGMTNKEIASEMKLQAGTVKNLVSLLLNKANCVSRADLVRYALEKSLVEKE